MLVGDDDLFTTCITRTGTAPPFHWVGGVWSPFDPPPAAVALAAPCLACLGRSGRNSALALSADTSRKLAARPCGPHHIRRWISAPLLGRAGLPRCAARPPDHRCRRCLPIQSRNLHCALPAPAYCRLVNRIPRYSVLRDPPDFGP